MSATQAKSPLEEKIPMVGSQQSQEAKGVDEENSRLKRLVPTKRCRFTLSVEEGLVKAAAACVGDGTRSVTLLSERPIEHGASRLNPASLVAQAIGGTKSQRHKVAN
jgi:hypothetical protein